MKLILELLTLLLLFVLFRGAVRRFLPKKAEMQQFSPESLEALRKFRMRYFQLLLVFIVIFGAALYYLLVFIKDELNWLESSYHLYFPLKNSALWQPALLGGLLIGSLVAFRLNRKLQADGLSFYLEELQELAQGYQSFGTFRTIQYVVGLVLFSILSYSALNTGLALDKQALTLVHPWEVYEKFSFQEIKKLDSPKTTQLLLNEKDTINISIYKYDSKALEEFISNRNGISSPQ